jgi:hypothetical protein
MALQGRQRLAAAWAVQIARRLHRTALRLFPTAVEQFVIVTITDAICPIVIPCLSASTAGAPVRMCHTPGSTSSSADARRDSLEGSITSADERRAVPSRCGDLRSEDICTVY